jgi:acyl carrier protein
MDRFMELVGIVLKRDPGSMTDDASPKTVEGWDSLAHTLMVSLFEEEYGVTFSPEEIAGAQSLLDFRRMLAAKGASF